MENIKLKLRASISETEETFFKATYIDLNGKLDKKYISISIVFTKSLIPNILEELEDYTFKSGYVKIKDVLFDVDISKVLEYPKYNRIEALVYEMLGRYFGTFEGSKKSDEDFFEIDNKEIENFLVKYLGKDIED